MKNQAQDKILQENFLHRIEIFSIKPYVNSDSSAKGNDHNKYLLSYKYRNPFYKDNYFFNALLNKSNLEFETAFELQSFIEYISKHFYHNCSTEEFAFSKDGKVILDSQHKLYITIKCNGLNSMKFGDCLNKFFHVDDDAVTLSISTDYCYKPL